MPSRRTHGLNIRAPAAATAMASTIAPRGTPSHQFAPWTHGAKGMRWLYPMYGARQASSVSVYAVSDPVAAQAIAGHAIPISPLNTAATLAATRSRTGKGSVFRVHQR